MVDHENNRDLNIHPLTRLKNYTAAPIPSLPSEPVSPMNIMTAKMKITADTKVIKDDERRLLRNNAKKHAKKAKEISQKKSRQNSRAQGKT